MTPADRRATVLSSRHHPCDICCLLIALAALAALPAGGAHGQPVTESDLPVPRLLMLFPPGGRAGTAVDVTFSGADIDEAEGLIFSCSLLHAVPLPTAAPDPKKAPTGKGPPLATVRFRVTIPADTPIGTLDVRLVNRWGVSNPRAFEVGELSEVSEREPNNDVGQAQRVGVGVTVNATIALPTDVDYFAFTGQRGQRILCLCRTASIDSRMHAGLELYDARGHLLAAAHAEGDAILDSTLPADAEYLLRVCEYTYTRGGQDFFYRLTISTAPWVDAVVPPVVETGKTARLTLYGRNLPGGALDGSVTADGRPLERLDVHVEVPDDPDAPNRVAFSGRVTPESSGLDGFEYRLRSPAGTSNPVFLTYVAAPLITAEGKETPETAAVLTPPCVVGGRLAKPRERHWYALAARKGQVFSIELISERLGAPGDVYFAIRDPAGRAQGELDDDVETLHPVKFPTRTTDPPRVRFVARVDGVYHVMVAGRGTEHVADGRQVYALRVTPEQPDFRLIVMAASDTRPDACRLPQGGDQALTVLAWRRDGFAGEIALSAEGLPSGVTCPPQMIAPGAKQATLVLSAAPDAPTTVCPITVKGSASIAGRLIVRAARPASVTWPVVPQTNVPTISRLDRGFFLAVRPSAPYRVSATLDRPDVVQGETAKLSVSLTRLWPSFIGPVRILPADPLPQLVVNNNQFLDIAAGKDMASATVTVRPTTPPGRYGIVLRTSSQVPFAKDGRAKSNPAVNVVLPTTPVILTVRPRPTVVGGKK